MKISMKVVLGLRRVFGMAILLSFVFGCDRPSNHGISEPPTSHANSKETDAVVTETGIVELSTAFRKAFQNSDGDFSAQAKYSPISRNQECGWISFCDLDRNGKEDFVTLAYPDGEAGYWMVGVLNWRENPKAIRLIKVDAGFTYRKDGGVVVCKTKTSDRVSMNYVEKSSIEAWLDKNGKVKTEWTSD